MNFNQLIKASKNSVNINRRKIKLAILGNHATQFLSKAIHHTGILYSIDFDIYEAEYDQVELEILNPSSGLYEFQPDFIFITLSALKLQHVFYKLSKHEKETYAETMLAKMDELRNTISTNGLKTKIILSSIELQNDSVFGNYYSKVKESFYYQSVLLNTKLMELSNQSDNLYLLDINNPIRRKGIDYVRDWSNYINSDVHYSLDFHVDIAQQLTGFIASFKGDFKKCLILDLDNTLWGGIIGDDGIGNIQIGSLGIGKAFSNLQNWIKQLKSRGIILAVCSKNDEDIAKEPFNSHPDMALKLDDISVFVANWDNKADNIRYIQDILNIGFDSMVFLDDNPAEREMVRNNLPQVCVPELPEDPSLYLDFLISQNLFETSSYSENDSVRTKQYQEEAERKKVQFSYTNMEDYLRSLEMVATVNPFLEIDFSRLAQLSQRSNQFNLRTVRYTVDDIVSMSVNDKYLTYSVNLKDKFGDYGLISMITVNLQDVDTAFIENWIMSCRVLKRGVEEYVLNRIVEDLGLRKINTLIGEYIVTPKNKLVENHYSSLGFSFMDDKFILKINSFQPLNHFIN